MNVLLTLAGGLPSESIREMILKLPIEGLADIEMVKGLGIRYAVRVNFTATEKRDHNR